MQRIWKQCLCSVKVLPQLLCESHLSEPAPSVSAPDSVQALIFLSWDLGACLCFPGMGITCACSPETLPTSPAPFLCPCILPTPSQGCGQQHVVSHTEVQPGVGGAGQLHVSLGTLQSTSLSTCPLLLSRSLIASHHPHRDGLHLVIAPPDVEKPERDPQGSGPGGCCLSQPGGVWDSRELL